MRRYHHRHHLLLSRKRRIIVRTPYSMDENPFASIRLSLRKKTYDTIRIVNRFITDRGSRAVFLQPYLKWMICGFYLTHYYLSSFFSLLTRVWTNVSGNGFTPGFSTCRYRLQRLYSSFIRRVKNLQAPCHCHGCTHLIPTRRDQK